MTEQQLSSFTKELMQSNVGILTRESAARAAIDIGDTPELSKDGKTVRWNDGSRSLKLNWPYAQ